MPYGARPRIRTGVHVSNAPLETAAGLLADRTATTRPGPPRRRWGVITGPKRFRAVVGRRA
ncbi:hypothetical protein [Glycomyces harbinensis]|uniref:hypothetical protein n=1 Tax=Glycomyces harbinensis TaxID=58114 RepID=UPI000B88A0D1|nr:hypothetical protein [Glycomyces harbinensis]